MSINVERELTVFFAHDAARSLDGADLLVAVQRRHAADAAQPRRRTTAWVAGTTFVVALGTVGATALMHGPSRSAAPTTVENIQATGPIGALPDAASMSCAYEYPNTLEDKSLAFDGTVVAIGGSHVQFAVNEAFVGVDTPEVTVQMSPPNEPDQARIGEFTPGEYGVGSRFLVSGVLEVKPGGEPTAWGCGFTRYWDESTAAAWRNTFENR